MRDNKNNISCSVKNITLNLENIKAHFTEKVKIITLIPVIIMLSFVNITLCFPNIFDGNNVSALSYSTDVNIGFTFNPTISLSISPDNLTIPNLTPGTALESNTITVNVATNTAYGYNLTANVGSNTTNYNTTNLVHTSSATSTPTSNATFASLAYGSSVSDKDNLPANTWGYSYSEDSGNNNNNNWQPYNGLPLYSDTNHSTNLISTYTAADSKSIEFKIAAKANNTQPSGDYTNIINFYATSVPEPPLLYDVVEDMTKGTLAENNVKLSDPITQANSGVYTYDPTVYGTASDASNDYPIYFYRGILDTDAGLGTYGSDGKADAWPNYVKLSNNTCWRIVRTTGSGGVKMIYNGTYKNGTCANNSTNAQIGTIAFNTGGPYYSYMGLQSRNIHSVGYTYSNIADGTSVSTILSNLFGANENYATINVNPSMAKQYIENWYDNSMPDENYTSKLEDSAGYCNDRTLYNSNYNELPESAEIIPYGNVNYVFGAFVRTRTTRRNITLNCPRGDVDLYSTNTIYGNGQLNHPVALITADEAAFTGSGHPNGGTSYSENSYLYSGKVFWLLSPYDYVGSVASVSDVRSDGTLQANQSHYINGIRPAISLMHHIQVTSGSGTATNPYLISVP